MRHRIGLDASGGDHAPREVIKGAVLAHKEFKQDIVLIGLEDEIVREAKNLKIDLSPFEIVNAPEKITMAEPPATSVRKKKKSSISLTQ